MSPTIHGLQEQASDCRTAKNGTDLESARSEPEEKPAVRPSEPDVDNGKEWQYGKKHQEPVANPSQRQHKADCDAADDEKKNPTNLL
jgi:hypothetical protein